MSGTDDMVTIREWERFRDDLDRRFSDLWERIEPRFDGLDQKFVDLNGRTRKQAEAIIALDAQVSAIAKRGCAQYERHREFIESVSGPGVSRRQQIAVAAGSGAGFVGVIEVVKMAMQHFWK